MSSSNTWEEDARAERAAYDARSIDDLLEEIRRKNFGRYYTIWYSVAARSSLFDAGWQLFEVLEHQSYDQMYRYHCAAALIQLMQTNRWHPDDLTHNDDHQLRVRLRELRQEMTQRMKN